MRRALALLASLFACTGDKPPEVATLPIGDAGLSPIVASNDKPARTASRDDGDPSLPKAPTFSLASMTTSGKVEIAPGKVVIVDFWATWCEPCKKSFPKLQELYVKYKSSGLEIAAISVDDDRSNVAAFARAYGARFPVGWDDGHQVTEQFKPETMPTTYIVDKQGRIRHVHRGYHDGEVEELEREIKELL
jgi:peroxiredoxin